MCYLLSVDLPLLNEEIILLSVRILNDFRALDDFMHSEFVHLHEFVSLDGLVITPSQIWDCESVCLIEIFRETSCFLNVLLQNIFIIVRDKMNTFEFLFNLWDRQLLWTNSTFMTLSFYWKICCKSKCAVMFWRETNIDKLSVILFETRTISIIETKFKLFLLQNIKW